LYRLQRRPAAGARTGDEFKNVNPFDTCWYAMSRYRPLYPEDTNLSDKDIARRQYEGVGQPLKELPNPWLSLAGAAAFATGVPLAVLAFGIALYWALAGFAASKQV
jgi:hypothetical protein